jgi:2-dehydro-3-deoxyphosphogluconate aldolase / (4S)-4-hydroxy-2-oxoglutarate aldolase
VSPPPALPVQFTDQRVVAVARRLDRHRAVALGAALTGAGLQVIEVTMEGGHGAEAIEALRDLGACVGAGTVTTAAQAADAVAAGASFLVSPHTDPDLITWATAHDVPFIPGAFTATEVVAARKAGASAVKLFPASVGGPALVRALLAPFPDLRLVPTGGVGADDAADYLAAGAVAVGVGDWLTGGEDLEVVAARAAQLLHVCGTGRPGAASRVATDPPGHLV